MLKTTIMLSRENQEFWQTVLPKGQKGHVVNYLLDNLRRDCNDPLMLAEVLTEVTLRLAVQRREGARRK